MAELDDLPKMMSLSPGPHTSLEDRDVFDKMTTPKEGFRRHNLDAEAIEVFWKQDCDLGLTLRDFDPVRSFSEEEYEVPEKVARLQNDWQPSKLPPEEEEDDESSLDKLWAGLEYDVDSETGEYVLRSVAPAAAPAAAVSPPVVPSSVDHLNSAVDALDSPLLAGPIPTTIDELLSPSGCDGSRRTQPMVKTEDTRRRSSGDSGQGSLAGSPNSNCTAFDLGLLGEIEAIEAAQNASRQTDNQPRRPFNRLVSMEQRWQDLASVLLLAPSQAQAGYPPARALPTPQFTAQRQESYTAQRQESYTAQRQESYTAQRQESYTAQRPEPMFTQRQPAQLSPGLQAGFSAAPAVSSQTLQSDFAVSDGVSPLTSPVAPSMLTSPVAPSTHLTPEHQLSPASGASAGDPLYYQLSPVAAPAVAPPSLDQDAAFLSQLLGVDALDLTDLPLALAPQDWTNGSGQTSPVGGAASPPADHAKSSGSGLQELGAFQGSSSPSTGQGQDTRATPAAHRLPVAQKKHQMFGRRPALPQDGVYGGSSPSSHTSVSPSLPSPASPPRKQHRYGAEGGLQPAYPPPNTPALSEAASAGDITELKYSRTPQFAAAQTSRLSPVAHNHTYQQLSPAEGPSQVERPVARDKAARRGGGERLSRDERRTREMNIPMSADEIVQLPMEEFNERLAKLQLSEAQLSLVRDVRRRGKNKMAAQNCRKRKLDQIFNLADDLQKVKDDRQRNLADHQRLQEERARIRDKYAQIHRHVFQSLRDPEGNSYSPAQFSLQLSADGDVLLVPRGAARGAAFVPDAVGGARRKQRD